MYLTTKIQFLLPKKCFAPISLPTGIVVQVEFDVRVPGGGRRVGVCLCPRSHQRRICSDGDGSCHAQMTRFSHKNVIISAVESGEVHRKFSRCKCLCKQKNMYLKMLQQFSHNNFLRKRSIIIVIVVQAQGNLGNMCLQRGFLYFLFVNTISFFMVTVALADIRRILIIFKGVFKLSC